VSGLADAGVFAAGGVLVGTHAFIVIGNLLGVQWASDPLERRDVDVGSSREVDVDIAVPDLRLDLPAALDNLKMGFLPVRPWNPRLPSTSFQGSRQALRVDLLCPQACGDDAPIFIHAGTLPRSRLGISAFSSNRLSGAVIIANGGLGERPNAGPLCFSQAAGSATSPGSVLRQRPTRTSSRRFRSLLCSSRIVPAICPRLGSPRGSRPRGHEGHTARTDRSREARPRSSVRASARPRKGERPPVAGRMLDGSRLIAATTDRALSDPASPKLPASGVSRRPSAHTPWRSPAEIWMNVPAGGVD